MAHGRCKFFLLRAGCSYSRVRGLDNNDMSARPGSIDFWWVGYSDKELNFDLSGLEVKIVLLLLEVCMNMMF